MHLEKYLKLITNIWNLIPTLGQWFLIGFFLGIGFLVPIFWPIVFIGIGLFIQTATNSKTIKSAVFGGWLAITIKSLLSLSFLWTTLPLDWLAIHSSVLQITVVFIGWLIGGLSLGASGGVLAYFIYKIPNKYQSVWFISAPIIGITWLFSELFGSLIYSITTGGSGTYIQDYFSFGYVGYLLANSNLGLWLSMWWGVHGLTLILVFCTIIIWKLHGRPKYIVLIFFAGAFFGCSVLDYIQKSLPITYQSQGITVAAIDTKFSDSSSQNYPAEKRKTIALNQAVEAALVLKPDYILLPEDSRFLNLVYHGFSTKQSIELFQFLHSTSSTKIIDSGRTKLPTGLVTERASIFSDKTDSPSYFFDKQYLVPGGEFIPYVLQYVMTLMGYKEVLTNQSLIGNYKPGPLKQHGDIDNTIPGVLFCFESARPDGVATIIHDRTKPQFIAHPISHAWFHTPNSLWRQLDTMLQIQAVWQRVPIVSANNMSVGKTYLPNGKVLIEPIIAYGDDWSIRLVHL